MRILATWSVALVAVLLLGRLPDGQLRVGRLDGLGSERDIGQLPLPGIGGGGVGGGGRHGDGDVLGHGHRADGAGRLGKLGHHLVDVCDGCVHGVVVKGRKGRNGVGWREAVGEYIVVGGGGRHWCRRRLQRRGCEILDAELGNGSGEI